MTTATENYLREMSPTLLRRTIYDSMRAVHNARNQLRHHPEDLRARHIFDCNESFVPAARAIAAERGITLKAAV